MVANRVLGQFDFVHNGANVLTNTGLWNPRSVAVDSSVVPNRLYVADAGNHRVLGWRSIAALTNGSPADVVIGQADFLSWASQCNNAAVNGETLCVPAGIAVDKSGNLYVVDEGNNRVLEYNTPFTTGTLPDVVFGQDGSFTASACNNGGSITAATLCNPSDVAVDGKGNLYIADTANSRVLEYNTPLSDQQADRVFGKGGSFTIGTCAAGANANSLCRPAAVGVDAGGNLYVADDGNFRVLEYDTPVAGNNTTADLVFGQGNDFGSKTNSCVAGASAGALCTPDGLGTDGAGNLYIADGSFSRIQEYNDPAGTRDTTPDTVFGQPGFSASGCNNGGLGPAGLCLPFGLAVDAAGDLFAADFGNQRLLEYAQPLAIHPPNTDASLVLGQTALDLNGVNGAKPSSLFRPAAVAVDLSASPNRLYVADSENSRVLGWKSVPSFVNGAPADLVIGQVNLLSAGCNQNHVDAMGNSIAAADTLCSPGGVAVDAGGNLYVADSNNFRVLGYGPPFGSGMSAGQPAILVLGQNGSFTARVNNNGGVNGASMSVPAGVAIDNLGHLYVADPFNNRVLEYDHPTTANTAADAVFGQGGNFAGSDCNFNSACGRTGCPAAANSLCSPSAVAVDGAGNAYIADSSNNRVLEFFSPLTNQSANLVIGQNDFKGVTCTTLCQPQGVAIDSAGNLFAANTLNAQINEYNAPFNSGALPNLVIGTKQCDQAVAKAGTLCGVAGLGFDSAGNLYAADTFDNRVLEFNQPLIPPTPTPTPTRTPTATPTPSPPSITSIPPAILVGASFKIGGSHFTQGSVVNFFVATAKGPFNAGPLMPATESPTALTVKVPVTTKLGQGFAEVQVVNTDRGYAASNLAPALLQGSAAAGIPSLTSINGVGLAATSRDPNFATNNVDTVVVQGSTVKLGGTGFDTAHGVAVDLYCACPGDKVGPFFLNRGNPGLSSTLISFPLPSTGSNAPATGPGSFVVSNNDGTYSKKSNAVSVPIGQRIKVASVTQRLSTITVNGTGFSKLTVINFFNTQGAKVMNLGGLKPGGAPKIPLAFVNQNKFTFTKPAGAAPGASYVQAFNPPFVPFSSSDSDPGGSFMLK